jgi:hypothetical protein
LRLRGACCCIRVSTTLSKSRSASNLGSISANAAPPSPAAAPPAHRLEEPVCSSRRLEACASAMRALLTW